MSTYEYMCEECKNGDVSSEAYDRKLQQIASTHNVSIAVVSSMMEPVKVYSTEPQDRLMQEVEIMLFGYIDSDKIIERTTDYLLFQNSDKRMNLAYIEMWGQLPNHTFFLMRTPVESIKNSAVIASRFVLYIGIGAMLVSALFIYFFSGKFSKPILELANISDKMSTMDFDAKYEGSDQTEIGFLGKNINSMSKNLEHAISELKEANVRLQQDIVLKNQAAEKRKEFVSNVSHELKTPIALIQGYAEGLKEVVEDEEERNYYCDVIMDEASKMNEMVKQLLTLNQLESGASELRIERFDVLTLIKNYIQSAEILTKQNDIKVTVEECGPLFVWADEFKIEEVVMNFFSNAINHCESDTQKCIDVFFEKSENNIKITIFNTGALIPEDSIDKIWDKFYKVDKARTREYGGSGIGLSIVKAIIDSHNQKCGVYNREDGVCFWFTLDSRNDSINEAEDYL